MLKFAGPPSCLLLLSLADPSDRRQSRRYPFLDPLAARVSRRPALVLDLSSDGACIAHRFPLEVGQQRVLDFLYEGERLAVQAEVIRSRLHDIAPDQRLFRSGLRFLQYDEALWAVLVSLALDHMRITAA